MYLNIELKSNKYMKLACQYQRFAYDRYHLASRKLQHKFSLNRINPFCHLQCLFSLKRWSQWL